MKPEELVALCDDAIARHAAGEIISDQPKIMLTMPYDRRRPPRSNRVRLAGRSSPLGCFMSVNTRYDPPIMITCFDARAVKSWVERGLSQMAHGAS
ncbi:hypothetical protein [Caulobacter segnis]|uniref:hypothetical protein n=1 Tax=Caulobacter segnis TaxID=88688 RepID=UPI0026EFAD4C|nr:hypothetical protein [Caulobacter segnis]